MSGLKIELVQESPISLENRNGRTEVLACPNRVVRPLQFLVHSVLSIVGLFGILTGNVLLATPMVVMLSPFVVFIVADEFYRSVVRFNDGFDLGVGRNVYSGYGDFLFEILHPVLRYNARFA